MRYTFYCHGHENITARHCRTLEFTREKELTSRGDCIIGVGADFDKTALKALSGKVRIVVEVEGMVDTFKAIINPDFDDDHEIVFRKSLYNSKRTLGYRLNRAANRLQRDIVQAMQSPGTIMKVTIEESGKKRRESRPSFSQDGVHGNPPRQEEHRDWCGRI